jgi:hypothetical protein
MSLLHSRENYLKLSDELIVHLSQQLNNTEGRKAWTNGNLSALQSFSIDGSPLLSYPQRDGTKLSGLRGQFLWDHMSCTDEDVILIAETEWNNSPVELKHDFEKLLYTRCPIKLMMCGLWDRDGSEIAKELRDYAKSCSKNFGPGEVFILYCVGWMNSEGAERNDQVFRWQVPGEVASYPGDDFEFSLLKQD